MQDIKLKAKDKGQIVLKFDSNDDFSRVIEFLVQAMGGKNAA